MEHPGSRGLLCPDMPEEYGAAGTTPQVTFAIIEELSRMGFGGIATGYGIHSNIVAPYINHFGTEEQKEHWLPKMVSGEAVGALAMTEPGAGSDVQGIRTNAVRMATTGSSTAPRYLSPTAARRCGDRGRHHRPGQGRQGHLTVPG